MTHCNSYPSTVKRPALLTAAPPATTKRLRTQCDLDNGCVVCKGTADTKANPLQLPSESTWDGLCGKAEE